MSDTHGTAPSDPHFPDLDFGPAVADLELLDMADGLAVALADTRVTALDGRLERATIELADAIAANKVAEHPVPVAELTREFWTAFDQRDAAGVVANDVHIAHLERLVYGDA